MTTRRQRERAILALAFAVLVLSWATATYAHPTNSGRDEIAALR